MTGKTVKKRILISTALTLGLGISSCIYGGAISTPTSAAGIDVDTPQTHIDYATKIAGADQKGILLLCGPRGGPPRPANNTAEPAKVFDNLYFLGIPSVSAWALTTSDGIILLDTLDNAQEAQTYIEGGLKKLGLDPATIKYIVITHAHGDHYGGAQYLIDKYHPKVVMSDIDWKVLEGPPRANYPANWGPIPKRDVSVKDGDTITLGDTTIDLYVTPPHTPGTLSVIMPLKDGATRHMGGEWGGTAFVFPHTEQNFLSYIASTMRFSDIARRKGVDVPISNHSAYDDALGKIAAMKAHPGGPNPFVMGVDGESHFLEVAGECARAEAAALRMPGGK